MDRVIWLYTLLVVWKPVVGLCPLMMNCLLFIRWYVSNESLLPGSRGRFNVLGLTAQLFAFLILKFSQPRPLLVLSSLYILYSYIDRLLSLFFPLGVLLDGWLTSYLVDTILSISEYYSIWLDTICLTYTWNVIASTRSLRLSALIFHLFVVFQSWPSIGIVSHAVTRFVATIFSLQKDHLGSSFCIFSLASINKKWGRIKREATGAAP